MALEGIGSGIGQMSQEMMRSRVGGGDGFGFAKGVVDEMNRGGSAGEVKFLEKVTNDVATGKIGSVEGGRDANQAGGLNSFGDIFKNEMQKLGAVDQAFKNESKSVMSGESSNIHRLQMLKDESMTLLKVHKGFHQKLTECYKSLWNLNV